jgi:hypothetical protein
MRKAALVMFMAGGVTYLGAACQLGGKAGRDLPSNAQPSASEPNPRTQPEIRTSAEPADSRRMQMTATDNPTTTGGRGEPSLEDVERPAVWIFVDGQAGKYAEREGHKQLQWVIEKPVGPSPSFRIEAYEPLLGNPRDLKYLIKSVESVDGPDVAYAVSAYDGAFAPGRDYSLLNPGEGFLIRNWQTGDVVREIALLSPGPYLIAATVINRETGKQAAAVTYFTVQ